MIVLSPLALLVAITIRLSGRGPVIYTQDRIGKNGRPFMIYKFRSMKFNSEQGKPLLSKEGEERVTKTGRYLRKYRIDEIPNFINVLKGDMALVGPRPERQFFIDQIVNIEPKYPELQKVKPGITSWGQVKYGYAENVQEMIKRLRYDILYIENMSLFVDLKILFYTAITIFKGRGV